MRSDQFVWCGKGIIMGRKGRNTTFEQRQLVIFHHAKCRSTREIAKMLNLAQSTVHDIVRRFKREDRIDSVPQKGRPQRLTAREQRLVVRKVTNNPQISAPKIAAELLQESGKKVHPETVRRVSRNEGFNGRVARRKPYISAVNRRKRMAFAKLYVNKDPEWWSDVIFADESKFTLWQSDGRVRVWRKVNEQLKKQNLQQTVKHGGGSVMVWGCMSSAGVGELRYIEETMTKEVYLDILKDSLHQSAEKLGIRGSFKFYQDNDPKHKAYIVRSWLLYNCPKVLETPPQSPDLNPIEHLWGELSARLRNSRIGTREELKRRLAAEWASINLSYI